MSSEFKEHVHRGEVPRLVLPELATRRLGGSPQLAVRRLVGSPQLAGLHQRSASMSRQLEEQGELRLLLLRGAESGERGRVICMGEWE